MAEDFYSILGVPRDASDDAIKKAYRRLARENHPDVNPNNRAAEERFKKATAAFEVLGNPQKRKLYDEFGEDAAKIGFDEKKAETLRAYKQAQSAGGGMPFGGGGGGAEFDLGELFGDMFGRGGGGGFRVEDLFGGAAARRAQGPVRGEDLSARVSVNLAEAVSGTERTLNLQRPGETQRLTVKIPPGVHTGSRVRVAGQGAPGSRGGPAGDLYLEVDVLPHPSVRREGGDLYMDLPITVPEAVLGAEVKVPTFDGEVTVRVPPGSQSGRKLRLRGKGVPSLKGGPRGDLYLTLQVQVPEKDTPQVRALVEPLGQAYGRDVRAALKL